MVCSGTGSALVRSHSKASILLVIYFHISSRIKDVKTEQTGKKK